MTFEEVKRRLRGLTIVSVEADEWDTKMVCLTASFGSVRITLSDGTVLDTLGESLAVNLPEKAP